MTFGPSTVCWIIAIILFLLGLFPSPYANHTLMLGLAFLAAGHTLGG